MFRHAFSSCDYVLHAVSFSILKSQCEIEKGLPNKFCFQLCENVPQNSTDKKDYTMPYVHSKFVQQEAEGLYCIPWPAKQKIAAQNLYTSLSARNSQKLCSLHSQLAKGAKNELQMNIL